MRTQVTDVLEALIPSKARTELLREFLLGNGSRRYLRELVQATGLPHGSVQHELANLVRAGVLSRQVEGHQVYYVADERCPILPELRSIIVKTIGVADTLKAALLPESASIQLAFVFGSYVRGDIRTDSDIDLFVVGSIKPRKLATLLRNVNLSRPVNPVVMSAEEYERLRQTDDNFLKQVLQTPRIMLIGEEDEPGRPT